MSFRHTITDIEDVQISDDGKELEVLYDSDNLGNLYVDIPIEFVKQRLAEEAGE